MPRYPLGKSRKLLLREDYAALRDAPHVLRGKLCIVFFKRTNRASSRLGMTIKGRTTSVDRSLIKRIVREWFRQSFPQSFLLTAEGISMDLNVFLNLPFRNIQRAQIKVSLAADLRRIFEKILLTP